MVWNYGPYVRGSGAPAASGIYPSDNGPAALFTGTFPEAGWSTERSRMYASRSNRTTGGIAVNNGPVDWISGLADAGDTMRGDGTRALPLLIAAAGSDPAYLQFRRSRSDRLVCANLDAGSGVAYTRMSLIRVLSWAAGEPFIFSAKVISYIGMLSLVGTAQAPLLQVYDGGSGTLQTPLLLNQWMVVTEIHNQATSSLQVNNLPAVTGALGGAPWLRGGMSISGGIDGDLTHFVDMDVASGFVLGRVLSAPEIAAAKTVMGARAGLTL